MEQFHDFLLISVVFPLLAGGITIALVLEKYGRSGGIIARSIKPTRRPCATVSGPKICRTNSHCDKGRKKLLIFAIQKHSGYGVDYTSSSICVGLLVEKVELENALNWLSTLGGAFSALGENDQNFAMKAGKVSKSQLYIAIKLGSPDIMSRCRLYAAISFIQLGKLREARKILEREYSYAKSLPDGADPRLKRMCIGIWCKLQYEWGKIRQAKIVQR